MKKNLFERYQDPTKEFSNRDYKISVWLIKNKSNIKKTIIVILIFFNVISLGISLIGWIKYFVVDYYQIENNLRILSLKNIDLINYRLKHPVEELKIGFIKTIKSDYKNKYNLLAEITNSNQNWYALINYKFTFQNHETKNLQSIIFPQQKSYLTYFGLETNYAPSNVKLIINNIKWQRIQPPNSERPLDYVKAHLNFTISDFKYEYLDIKKGQKNNLISFVLTNNTVYDYWDAKFLILYLKNNNIVGIKKIIFNRFYNHEQKPVNIKILNTDLKIDKIKVIPLFNVLSPNNYIPSSIQ